MTSGHVTGVNLLTVDKNLRVFTIAQNISSDLDFISQFKVFEII